MSRHKAATDADLADMAAKIHPNCVACGPGTTHSFGLGLRFYALPTDSEYEVAAQFKSQAHYQGYPGLLHGGITSTLLDAAMTHCLFFHKVQAVTAELQVRFAHPVPIEHWLTIQAKLVGVRRGIYQLQADLCCDSQRLARAQGKFIEPK